MTSGTEQQLKKIHQHTAARQRPHEQDYFFSFKSSYGLFWCNQRTITETISYSPDVPPGIHLGAGNASLMVSDDNTGVVDSESTVANYLIVPEQKSTRIITELNPGRVISCGLCIEWSALHGLPQTLLTFIQRRVTEHGLQTSPNLDKTVLERLCAPLSDQANGEVTEFMVEARVNELIARVMLAFCQAKEPPRGSLKQVLRARDMIDENLRSPMTQKQLGESVGLNVRSLSSHFKQHLGVTINQYVVKSRMERGYAMLQQGLTVSQTAYLVGYSLPYFSETFQKHFNLAPSQVATSSVQGQ